MYRSQKGKYKYRYVMAFGTFVIDYTTYNTELHKFVYWLLLVNCEITHLL